MCAQDVHTTHIATNMENIKDNTLLYIETLLHQDLSVLQSVGGTTPDTNGRPHGLRPQGWPSPQDEALRGTTLLGTSHKTPERYPEDTTRSVTIRMIP